ncbi:hepatitis A virus cellular receptor 1 homolog isoform X3 [Xenopus laevis]|uniref:Hepatitis A virus cellular receptor 1 homolog isoform X3 n=1 Tax=Xenopus laevis TaxID=8355 RepID=A0A8J1MQ97_XENLA|nr:hepatitis A virus cellular receptor 1 homolog isoform X3 [Xenopus laevis]
MLHSAATKQLITAVLLLCSVTLTCGDEVFGTEGQPVILPCTYKVSSTSDITTMCWGKNTCPSSKCNQPLVWTDGYKVTFTSSNRYELNGPIPKGTVSLTIKSVTLEDQGTYCCRVEHHGWFNDMKLNIRLVVKKAPVTTKSTITTLRTTTETIKPSAKPTTIPTTTYVPTTGNFITEHEDHHTTEFTTSFGNENRSPRETTQVNPIPTTESSSSSPSATTQVDEIHPEQGPLDNSQPGSSPFSGNVTIVETQKAGIPLYVLITVISVSVILITMVTLLVLKLRGKGSGAYFFHQNPSLELVTHADYLAEGAQTGEPELHKADWQVKAETNTDKENNKP